MKIGILFDFDGTLCDSLPGAYRGICHVCAQAGVLSPSFEMFLRTFSAPYIPCYRKLGITVPEKHIYDWYHAAANHEEAQLFPDVVSSLASLAEVNFVTVGIVTTQRQKIVDDTCRREGIDTLISFCHGNAEDKVPAIGSFCAMHQLDPSDVWYIGDFPSDMRDGRKAGVRCVGITRGNPVSDLLLEAGAEYCIEHLDELFPILGFKEQLAD